MALRITLGQYYPAQSPLHRKDPRAKLVCILVLVVTCFFINSPLQLAYGYAALVALVASSRVPLGKVLASTRALIATFAILSLFNLLVRPTGTPLAQLGPVLITTDGAWAAVLYTLRLVIAVVACALLLLTTTPTSLTDALDSLLSPLARLGLPAHEIAMIFSLMLRFIPTLADEASAVIDAQTARGGAFGQGSPVHRVKAVGPVIVALLASSMRHANGLSRALGARCYEGAQTRSRWHPLAMRPSDWGVVALAAAYVAGLLLLGGV